MAYDGREQLINAIQEHLNKYLVEEKDMFPGASPAFL